MLCNNLGILSFDIQQDIPKVCICPRASLHQRTKVLFLRILFGRHEASQKWHRQGRYTTSLQPSTLLVLLWLFILFQRSIFGSAYNHEALANYSVHEETNKAFSLAEISNPLQVLVIFSFYRSMQLSALAALHTFRSTIHGSRPSSSSFHRFMSLSASLTLSPRAGAFKQKS